MKSLLSLWTHGWCNSLTVWVKALPKLHMLWEKPFISRNDTDIQALKHLSVCLSCLSVFFFSTDNHKKQQIHLFLNIGDVTIAISDILFPSNSIKCKKDMNEERGFMRRISGLITPFCPFKKPAGVNPERWGAFSLPSKWTSSYVYLRAIQAQWMSLDEMLTDPGWKATQRTILLLFYHMIWTMLSISLNKCMNFRWRTYCDLQNGFWIYSMRNIWAHIEIWLWLKLFWNARFKTKGA